MRLGLLAPLFVVALSCKTATPPSGFGVDLTIDARSLAAANSVTQLSITTTGAETYNKTLAVATQIARGGVVHVRYVPGVTTGMLTFIVDALDDSGALVGEATGMPVALTAGNAVQLTLTLMGEMPDAGGQDGPPPSCMNAIQDPTETDVDCGGLQCPGCELGKMCKVDGDCATGSCVAATTSLCELATGPPSWTSIQALPVGRQFAAAGGPDDGDIYVYGGFTTAIEATTLRYSATTNDWQPVGSLAQAREGLTGVNVSGTLYAIGGEYTPLMATMDASLASLETLAPSVATMTPMWAADAATLMSARAYHASAIGSDGLIYVLGGETLPATAPLATVEKITPGMTSGTAALAPPLPTARTYLAAAADSMGRILAIGGLDGTAAVSSEVDIYDPVMGTWTKSPASLTTARDKHGAALGPDGRVYVLGGENGLGGVLSSVEALSPTTGRWLPIPDISAARGAMAVTTGWDGRIYAIGGKTQAGTSITVDAYGPTISPGPPSGPAGKSIALSLVNFGANAMVTVSFSGDPAGTIAVMGKTNVAGTLTSLVWLVPPVATGSYTLTAIDDHSRYPVRTKFTVTD